MPGLSALSVADVVVSEYEKLLAAIPTMAKHMGKIQLDTEAMAEGEQARRSSNSCSATHSVPSLRYLLHVLFYTHSARHSTPRPEWGKPDTSFCIDTIFYIFSPSTGCVQVESHGVSFSDCLYPRPRSLSVILKLHKTGSQQSRPIPRHCQTLSRFPDSPGSSHTPCRRLSTCLPTVYYCRPREACSQPGGRLPRAERAGGAGAGQG